MHKTAMMFALTFGFVLLVAGTALAVNKMCSGNCRGTAGDDRLVGSSRANTIYAEERNDRVLAREGSDTLYGEGSDHARDLLIYGPGRDKVFFARSQGVLKGCEIKRPSI